MGKALVCILILLMIHLSVQAQQTKSAVFYCIDYTDSTIYYSTGKAVVKKGLESSLHYQYGFMKWKGWISKSWTNLVYEISFHKKQINPKEFLQQNKIISPLVNNGYHIKEIPMPYPMKPYQGYKFDGTN